MARILYSNKKYKKHNKAILDTSLQFGSCLQKKGRDLFEEWKSQFPISCHFLIREFGKHVLDKISCFRTNHAWIFGVKYFFAALQSKTFRLKMFLFTLLQIKIRALFYVFAYCINIDLLNHAVFSYFICS